MSLRNVVICLKICTFVVSKTTRSLTSLSIFLLWFAWKSVPLWYLKQPSVADSVQYCVVICLKICTFVVSKTTALQYHNLSHQLWFAWKSVPLWYLKQRKHSPDGTLTVVICLKICTFVVSKTTNEILRKNHECCDLLENLYLCGI